MREATPEIVAYGSFCQWSHLSEKCNKKRKLSAQTGRDGRRNRIAGELETGEIEITTLDCETLIFE
jgi:hypothetical protein